MMKTTIFPMRSLHMRPAFWGVDRDLKEVIDSIENSWVGLGTTSSKSTEFHETDKAYLFSIDLPGVNKANLEIQVEGEHLIVNGKRKKSLLDNENEQTITHKVLIPKEADKDNIQAHCEDGVLYLAFPKVEKASPKKVEVTDGAGWKNLLGAEKKESNASLVD
jgi:HSP20 family protein